MIGNWAVHRRDTSQKQFYRYIPKLINDELDLIEYSRKDNLYVIIDLIHRKQIYYKSDLQNNYGYTEIPKAQFKELLPSSDNLQDDLQFLIDKNFIQRNDFYVIGDKSKAYKISSEYLGSTVRVKIENKSINKRIENQIKKYRVMKVKNLEFAKSEYYQTFKVNIEGANKTIFKKAIDEINGLCIRSKIRLSINEINDIIECKNDYLKNRALILLRKEGNRLHDILHRYMVYSSRLNAINDGFLFFKRNETNGRLDSNLTSLPAFLRPFIVSNERLINIDIKNSQPYFLYSLIKNTPEIEREELKKYSDLVISGQLYEFLADKYKEQTGYSRTRKQVKIMLCKVFYSKNYSFEKLKVFFGGIFPTIMEFINKTNSVKSNTLAIQLQTIESYTVLDVIMPLLGHRGIKPYTIHDSFICKESEAAAIEEVFTNKLKELNGVAPALHVGYIDAVEDDKDEVIQDWDSFIEELNAV